MAKATATSQRKADHAAFAVLPAREGLPAGGVVSLDALAQRLDAWGLRTPRKGASTATAVKRASARVA